MATHFKKREKDRSVFRSSPFKYVNLREQPVYSDCIKQLEFRARIAPTIQTKTNFFYSKKRRGENQQSPRSQTRFLESKRQKTISFLSGTKVKAVA